MARRRFAVNPRAGPLVALVALVGACAAAHAAPSREAPKPDLPPASSVGAQAQALAARGRYAEAIALLEDAVRRGPYDERIHYDLGELMTGHATAEEMVRFFSAEASRDRKPQTSHYYWAIGLARQKRNDEAIAQLRRALEIDPAHEMSQRAWGIVLERAGKPEEAYEHLVEATRIHPEYRQALEDAARLAKALGRRSEAAELERRARTADPDTPRCFLYWARYLHARGRDAAALAEIERGLAVLPGDAELLALRGTILAAR